MTGKEVLEMSSVRSFLDYFGIETSPLEEPELFIEDLKAVDPRYQGEHKLRYQLEADQTTWPEEAKGLIMACAEDMGMLRDQTNLMNSNNIVIVLGGARQSNLERTLFVVEAVKSGKAMVDRLIVAGSNRKLSEDEKHNVSNYAPGAETEFDLCSAAAKVVAGQNPGMITSQMLIANEKAGTPDVIEAAIIPLLGWVSDNHSITVVTTQIYQLSTEFDLRRITNTINMYRAYVAGCPSDPEVVAKRTTATYLSEVLRTLRAAALAAQAGV